MKILEDKQQKHQVPQLLLWNKLWKYKKRNQLKLKDVFRTIEFTGKSLQLYKNSIMQLAKPSWSICNWLLISSCFFKSAAKVSEQKIIILSKMVAFFNKYFSNSISATFPLKVEMLNSWRQDLKQCGTEFNIQSSPIKQVSGSSPYISIRNHSWKWRPLLF